jgi:hypothetical protein
MLEAALAYAKRGIPVFPCGDDKRPLTEHGFKDATTNAAVIQKRWKRWPDAMIGMPTGPMSGISVIDLDVKGNRDGVKAVPDWRKRSNAISRTQSKGAHLFFKDDGSIPSTTNKIAPGVDTRGKGGYVILPPSPGYIWVNATDLSDLPEWPDDLRPPVKVKGKGKRIHTAQPVEKEEIFAALAVIPSDDYQIWFEVGCALYKELGDDGFELFDTWSKKSDKYKPAKVEAKWGECEKVSGFTVGTIFHYADEAKPDWRGKEEIPEGATLEDFVANLEMHDYVYLINNRHWPTASVNARFPKQLLGGKKVAAAAWLDKKRSVQSITWAPGLDKLIMDRVVGDGGGWIEKKGDMTLNEYKPPTIKLGDAHKAKRWVDLVRKIFPAEVEHILDWLAQRVQHPGIKINHALILGGLQGIGKDTILAGVKPAVGDNWVEVQPKDLMSRFNAHVKSVILRVNEARDMGEINRYDFYESTKILTTSPPEYIPCEEKYQKRFYPMNVVGVIYTTNHKTGGLYLPPDDRRHFVAWSNLTKHDFTIAFWDSIYAWYRAEGWNHIAAFLHERDISKFNPYAPPPQTEAFRDIVEANLPTEDKEFAHAINLLGEWKDDGTIIRPPAVTVAMVKEAGGASFSNFFSDRRNARAIPHRFESCSYVPVRNPAIKLNRWRYSDSKGNRKEESIYSLLDFPVKQREQAARRLVEDLQKDGVKWRAALGKNKI